MAFKRSTGTRSPLKVRPLRSPGESTERETERVFDGQVMSYFVAAFVLVILTVLEWWRWYSQAPPSPGPITALTVAFLIFATYRFFGARRVIRSLQLGINGEKSVGQCLEDLRREGCQILHDVPGDHFNIDHIIVSPHGLFVVETKTLSKPVQGQPTVKFDGERILINGSEPDRSPVRQALAQRGWVKDFLQQRTARVFPVKAVVVFPGWFVEPATGRKRDDLWVLNPKAVSAFIKNEPILLKPEDVALATSTLADYVRAYT
jgi:hypothetical protein